MIKPRMTSFISRFTGMRVWCCGTQDQFVGLGYTPATAYARWRQVHDRIAAIRGLS